MRKARHRRYLMCPPTYFTVSYEINPWMHKDRPTDTARAVAQWDVLRETYEQLGHTVELVDPVPDLPDMVYTANGATVVDGVAYTARFRYPQRAAEAPAIEAWLAEAGFTIVRATQVNEGEGDILFTERALLAGTGFRSDHAAHLEIQETFGRPVLSLQLVDPRFYHLDTALAVLTDDHLITYYPGAFSPGSQKILARLFPDAVIADEADALPMGINCVSDGKHVIHPPAALGLAAKLRERGFDPIAVDTSELLKGGGGAKCCTLELRAATEWTAHGLATWGTGASRLAGLPG
jgi:N-dimethylarginine dimethylaminohydrolase